MSVDFNIHRFVKEIGRKSGLSVLTVSIMRRLHVFPNPHINEPMLGNFLAQIYKGYHREVEYHNDIHAADVLQMFYVMLTQGGLVELAQLNELDVLSSVVASICHDYDHDGLTNAYHVNAISSRAIRYSDKAVQENWHVAEAFTVLNTPEHNFMSNYCRDDFKTFRKRMIGIILATDMARHVTDLAQFKSLMDAKQVAGGVNAERLIDKESAAKEFDSKQVMLELFVHAADVSTQTRSFDIAVEWTWLLFEEFFF
jgi:cAMP-specific phosphodiesterase 4